MTTNLCSSGLHAHQYPRTDCAIITGIIDETGEKMLLGNNVRCQVSVLF